jgi:small subunit ribosomal protein S16
LGSKSKCLPLFGDIMAVRIRLARHGRKKAPFYRIVAADGRMPRDGRYLERLGHFDPMVESGQLVLDLERVDYWIGVGASPSDTAAVLIEQARAGAEG